MKKFTKRTAAAILCGALALSCAGCKNTTGTALTIDGEEIRAGIYIYYQLDALNEAAEKLSEEQPNLDMYAEGFKISEQTVEGLNVEEWVKNKTIEKCRYYSAINDAFDEYGLSLAPEEIDEIDTLVTSTWEEENMYAQYVYGVNIIGEYYEGLGIGKQSYEDVTTAGYKENAVFNYLYGEGGTNAVPTSELDAKIATDYALVNSFEIDPEVNSPDTYLTMLNEGKSFVEVEQAYNTDSALKDIEADMAAAEEAGEEYEGVLPENLEVAASELADLQSVINVEDEYPDPSYVADVFKMANGDNKVITVSVTSSSGTTTVTYYLVQRLDIAADEAVMSEYRETVLHTLKDEEFEASMDSKGAGYSVTENAAALKKYTVEKLGE